MSGFIKQHWRSARKSPLDVLLDQVAQFPTYTEVYLTGLGKLDA